MTRQPFSRQELAARGVPAAVIDYMRSDKRTGTMTVSLDDSPAAASRRRVRSLQAETIRLVNVGDRHRRLMARHEGGHIAAAQLLGWKVAHAEISSQEGDVSFDAPSGIGESRRLEDLALINLSARAYAGRRGDASDVVTAWHCVHELARRENLSPAVVFDRLQRRVKQLTSSREFRSIATRCADALVERGRLGPLELAEAVSG